MNSIPTTILSFEEWQALPETKQICEVVDGVLVMPPSPTDEHQWIGFEIATRLSNFVRERELGIILVAPRDVLIQRDPLRVRHPDVLFLSASRTGVRRPADLADNRESNRRRTSWLRFYPPATPPGTRGSAWATTGASGCRSAGWRVLRAEQSKCSTSLPKLPRPQRLTGWETFYGRRCCRGSSWLWTTCSGRYWGRGRL